ncbi:MAG: transcriptional regulator NrdR [Dehalococcoidia bacterium]
MDCPFCPAQTRVIDSRAAESAIRRRRECQGCGRRFTTYERVAELEPAVVKRDGRREPFQHSKLLAGIRLACIKRPLPQDRLEAIAEAVRTRAMRSAGAEVASREIGEWVLERLRPLDRVAAFRFAAVFRRPQDTDALRRELAAIEAGAAASPDGADADAQQPLPGIDAQAGAASAPRRPHRVRN